MARAPLSLSRRRTVTSRSAAAISLCRNPSASPIRMPVSYSTANNSRSRNRSHPSKMACTSAGSQHAGQLLRRLQRDRPARPWFALADVVQERLPPTARTAPLPAHQQLADIDPVAGSVRIEHAQRRQLPVHRRLGAVMRHRRQHRHPSIPRRQRQPQPRDELAHILKPHPPPIQATVGEEDEPVLQIVRIRLDRVRRAFDVGQIRQIPLDRRDRGVVIAENGPRLTPRDR